MCASLAGALLAFVVAGAARAQEPRDAACPSTTAVWTNVASLIGRERLPQAEPPSSLVARDLGDRYAIAIGDRRHEYADAVHDCAQRAQVAAVFVALTIVPPELLLPSPPPPPPPPPTSAPREPLVRLELGPTLGLVAHADGGPAAALVGAALRVALGRGRVVAVGGVAASLPTTSSLDGLRVREQRIPFELGARVRWRRPAAAMPWELGLEGTGVMTTLRLGGPGGPTRTVADGGVRAGAILSVGNRRWVPFVGIFADMSLSSRPVAFVPDGVVGHASWLRTGATAGVAGRFP